MRYGRLIAAAAVVAAAGCVQEKAAGSGSVFTFVWYIPLGITVVGLLVLVLAGLLFVARWVRGGFVAVLIGLIALAIGPNMFFDKAVVDNDHFELKTGFWFAPTEHAVRFDDVTGVQGVAEEKSGRRGRTSTSFFLVFTKRGGGSEKVPVGDLMKRGPADKVVAVLAKRGVPLSGVMPSVD